MSATADIGRYRDYFRGLGRGERVEVIAIPSSPQHAIYQRNVCYLDQVTHALFFSPNLIERFSFVPTMEQILEP